jgi:hypothetical protein
MEVDAIRESIQKGNFFVTDHAITEGFKDGISVADMVHAFRLGRSSNGIQREKGV